MSALDSHNAGRGYQRVSTAEGTGAARAPFEVPQHLGPPWAIEDYFVSRPDLTGGGGVAGPTRHAGSGGVESDTGTGNADARAAPKDPVVVCGRLAHDLADVVATLKDAGLAVVVTADIEGVAALLRQDVGTVVLSVRWLEEGLLEPLTVWSAKQPGWSGLPMVVVYEPGTSMARLSGVMAGLRNVVPLQWPVDSELLAGVVKAALRARRRQYESRDHLTELGRRERDLEHRDRVSRAALAELEALYNVTPAALALVGRDHRLLRVNRRLAELQGASIDELFRRPLEEAAPQLAAAVAPHLDRAFATGEPVRELVHAFDDGAEGAGRYWLLSLQPVCFEGEVAAVAAALVEATETMESGQRARLAHAELEAVYHQVPAGLCVLDRELRYVRVNRRLAEINGIPMQEHLGRTIRELMPQVADAVEDDFRRILNTGEPIIETEVSGVMPSQPGVVRHFLASYYPFRFEGRVVGINVVVQENTDRVRAAEDLRESAERLQLALQSAEMGTWGFDVATRVLTIDDRSRQIMALPPGVTQLSLPQLMEVILPEDRPRIARQVERALAPDGHAAQEFEYRVRDDEGNIRWVRSRGRVYFDEGPPRRTPGGHQDRRHRAPPRRAAPRRRAGEAQGQRRRTRGAVQHPGSRPQAPGRGHRRHAHADPGGPGRLALGEAADELPDVRGRVHPPARHDQRAVAPEADRSAHAADHAGAPADVAGPGRLAVHHGGPPPPRHHHA